MPRYVTDQRAPMRTVSRPLPPPMPYAAAPYLGMDIMRAMPSGGARLRIQPPVQKVTRDPNRYAPNVPREMALWRRRSLLSWSGPREVRTQRPTPAGPRPTQATGCLRPIGGRRFRVVR